MARRAARSPFVGRERELATLLEHLTGAGQGQGGLVLVAGEPGIGKTRLLTELADRAWATGWLVLAGAAYDAEGMPPYVPFIEALQDHARNCSTEQLQAQLGTSAPEVALLLPEVRRRLPHLPASAPHDAPSERYRLFESITDFLLTVARASAATGLLLWLDDLHWADEATLLLLEHLDRRIAAAPLLVVATYRDTEVDTSRPLARTLERLTRQGPEAVLRVDLGRFPEADTAALLASLAGRPPPAPLVQVVHAETEGNPFFVHEVYRYLAATGRLVDAQGGWRPSIRLGEVDLPPSVRLVLDRRLESVSEACRRALTAAAGIGRTFTFALLHATADQEEATLLDALDEAGRAHLLGSTAEDVEGRMSFAHELIRQTLLAGLSLPRRQQLHRRVAEAIEQLYVTDLAPHAAALAHHFVEAADLSGGNTAKAARYSRLAAQQAEIVAAWGDAEQHYARCLALIADAPDKFGEDEAALLLALGRCQTSEGNFRPAWTAFMRAISLFRERGDWAGSARAVLAALDVYATPDRHLALLDSVLVTAGGHDPHLEALLRAARAANVLAGDEVSAQDAAYAATLTEAHDYPDVRAQLSYAGAIRAERGWQVERATSSYREAAERYARLGDRSHAARALLQAAHMVYFAGRGDEAEAAYQATLRFAREVHQRHGEQLALHWLGQLAAWRGDIDQARARLDEMPVWGYYTHTLALTIAELTGDLTGVDDLLPPPESQGRLSYVLATAHGVRARALFLAGEVQRARQDLVGWTKAIRRIPDVGANAEHLSGISAAGGLVMAALADLALVRECYDRLRPAVAWRLGYPDSLDDLRGALALRLGLPDEAESWYHTGLQWSEHERRPFEAGRCLQGLAEVAHRRSRTPEALDLLDRAVAIYERHGAKLYLRLATARRQELQHGGARPTATSLRTAHPDGLSAREVDILRLLAAGKSNREISAALVLSVRTVERHIENIYVKTGVHNRTRATLYAQEHHLL